MSVVNPNGTDEGFVNHTLAYFNVSDFEPNVAPEESKLHNVSICRYTEYRNSYDDPHPYKRPLIYWQILALRLTFVVIYQNLVSFVQIVVAWAIPDVPSRLQDQIKREQYLTNEYIIEQEKLKIQRTATAAGAASSYTHNGYLPSEDSSPDDERLNYGSIADETEYSAPPPDDDGGNDDDADSFQAVHIVTSRV